MMSRSSPPWPRSTATAMTSAPMASAIQPMATEVSRPPEYARTTRSVTGTPYGCHRLYDDWGGSTGRIGWRDRVSSLATGQGQQPAGKGPALRRATGDDHDGVVARDGAKDVRLVRVVNGRSQVVRGSGRRPHDHQVGRDSCSHEELLALSPQARAHLIRAGGHPGGAIAALAGHGIHEGLTLTYLDREGGNLGRPPPAAAGPSSPHRGRGPPGRCDLRPRRARHTRGSYPSVP